jgi:peptide subunit release factor 1 (eRF1)
MAISLYLPKGTRRAKEFVDKELATASNIKDLQTRKDIVAGLTKISHVL